MSLSLRIAGAGATAALVIGAWSAPAFAAPPGNDTHGGRVVVSGVPYNAQVDTTEATTDADDTPIRNQCGAPATDASVWYEFSTSTAATLIADARGSSYSAGVAVATGAPGSLTVVSCGPGGAVWDAEAGTTYTLLVFDDQTDGVGNGGALDLVIDVAPPPPDLEVTVNPTALFDSRTGSAIVSGTILCGADADFAFLEAQLTQRVGRVLIRGFGGTEVTCDGTTRPYTLEIIGDNGLFKGGKAAQLTFSAACSVLCSEYFAEQTIQLKGGRK
jgi:hypothetical protein